MEGGDIGNAVVPRLMLVFENLVGILPSDKHEQRMERLLRRKKYQQAADLYEVNALVVQRLWDVTFRLNFSFDVVTWVSVDFAKAVRVWIDENDLPIQRVTFQDKMSFARKIAYMPYVARLYVPDSRDQFIFGSRCTILNPGDPTSLDQIGRF